jgi:hypothetical protein
MTLSIACSFIFVGWGTIILRLSIFAASSGALLLRMLPLNFLHFLTSVTQPKGKGGLGREGWKCRPSQSVVARATLLTCRFLTLLTPTYVHRMPRVMEVKAVRVLFRLDAL